MLDKSTSITSTVLSGFVHGGKFMEQKHILQAGGTSGIGEEKHYHPPLYDLFSGLGKQMKQAEILVVRGWMQGACRKQGNMDIALGAAKRFLHLEPQKSLH